MAAKKIGSVRSGKSKRSFDVTWDSYSNEVYVSWAGWKYIGKAYSASDAMNKAEAYLYDK